MGKIRFALVLHNHQPVGNFDGVFEAAYQDSYLPFLEAVERRPEIPFSLHTSGCLMEWLVEHHPEYVEKLRRLVSRGQVEILGGAFYEPILPMIPPADRQGQIRGYTEYLLELFGVRPRGMWIAERVWEQHLVSDLAQAGIDYTVLDDFHFRKAGLAADQLHGYYISESDGRVLRIFPGSEPMRYLIPFQDVERSIDHLREVRRAHSGALVVFADDGEKFGTWPETKAHVYGNGWLKRFFDAIAANLDWIEPVTLAQAIDKLEPIGRVYLPDCSYREMTEWALPAERLVEYEAIWHELDHRPEGARIKEFLKGGFWRNFKVRYPETNEMYARMMQVSQRLERLCQGRPEALADVRLHQARTELYRGQCNCAYWHGAFGGLYLPHLRNAVYSCLIRAENQILAFERPSEPRFVAVESRDLNYDGRPEVRIENDQLAAFFDPAQGGCLYELDLRSIAINLGSSLTRRPEAYHEKVRRANDHGHGDFASIHDRVVFKQNGLKERLAYDGYPRKSFLDHFYPPGATLEEVQAGRAAELGDFLTGKYRATIAETGDQALLSMSRRGKVNGRDVVVTKAVSVHLGQSALRVRYRLENLPQDETIHFAVELNLAALAANADDRYFELAGQHRIGRLGSVLETEPTETVHLVDEWLGIDLGVNFSRPACAWTYPVQSVSGSEAGFELVHQSVCLVPHWEVPPSGPVWDVEILLAPNVRTAPVRTPVLAL